LYIAQLSQKLPGFKVLVSSAKTGTVREKSIAMLEKTAIIFLKEDTTLPEKG